MKGKYENALRAAFIGNSNGGTFKNLLAKNIDVRYQPPEVIAAFGCYILCVKRNCGSIDQQRAALEKESKYLLPLNIYKFISGLLDQGIRFTMDDHGEDIERLYAEHMNRYTQTTHANLQLSAQEKVEAATATSTCPASPISSEGGGTNEVNTSLDEEQPVAGNATTDCSCL